MMGSADPGADADEVLAELSLTHLADATACDLGYGEQRRLDLAIALVGRPTVLLLDEPMAGLSCPTRSDAPWPTTSPSAAGTPSRD